MSNETNIEELERLAKAAAPGPWYRQDFYSGCEKNGIDDSDGDIVCASYGSLRPKSFDFIAAANPSAVLSLINRLKKAEAELENERMRLTACGVVAMADTPESAAKAREMRDEYRSASCDDVARRVDECMTLRAERDALASELANQRARALSECDRCPHDIDNQKLLEERDALARDAERYRWIRGGSRIGVKWCELHAGGPALDDAIDSTMRALPSTTAKARFDNAGGHEEPDPIERLRFFYSKAMIGQDWFDVEQFFDAVIAERGTLAAKLKDAEHDRDEFRRVMNGFAEKMAELEGQEPVAWMTAKRDMASFVNFHDDDLPLYARPVSAEPVNAHLLTALIQCRDRFAFYVGHHLDKGDLEKAAENEKFVAIANDAIASAESAPKAVRLTGEEIIGIRQVLAGWDCNTPWSQTIALSRAIETAVLRKNGIKVAE